MTASSITLLSNLFCFLTIFVSAFYTVLHNRTINKAIITMIWYVGLAAFFPLISIVLQLIFGVDFPLAYQNVHETTETILNITVAATLATLFLITIKTDIVEKKNRNSTMTKKKPKK